MKGTCFVMTFILKEKLKWVIKLKAMKAMLKLKT